MEQTEEWTVQRGRYLTLETLAPVCDELSACLPRSATDQLGPLISARPAVNYTTRWGTIHQTPPTFRNLLPPCPG